MGVLSLQMVAGGPNCDDALGAGLCPDAFSLDETGACLVANKGTVDEACALFIEINEACEGHLVRCGDGIQWGSDAVLCATQWTRQADLTADCADVLAKLPQEGGGGATAVEEEESEETKAKKAKRKAARKRAANDVRKLNAENEREAAGAKKKSEKKKKKDTRSRKERTRNDDDL